MCHCTPGSFKIPVRSFRSRLRTRPFAIAQLFSNLVGNAVTHGAPERPIRVRATTQDGKFELSVANAGEPIASEAMERLFQTIGWLSRARSKAWA